MRSTVIMVAAFLSCIACSTHKYSYYFDQYDYQAGKQRQLASKERLTETTSPALGSNLNERAIPDAPGNALALASTDFTSMVKKDHPIIKKERKATPSLTREQRREVRKGVMAALKTYKHDIKTNPDVPPA